MRYLKGIWLNVLVAFMTLTVAATAFPTISGFTTRATGDTITASIWNSELGGIYTYINNNIVALFNTLTTKGDIFGFDGSNYGRLGVGTNNQVLTADSAQPFGIKWASVANVTNLTTKGDLLGFDTANNRIPVGSNGQVLTARSTNPLGVAWEAAQGVPVGVIVMWSGSIATIPSGWQLCDGTGGTPNLQGLFIMGAGNVSPAATGGAGLIAPGGPAGDTSAGTGLGPAHTHSLPNNFLLASGAVGAPGSITGSSTITPRYYALAYIQKI